MLSCMLSCTLECEKVCCNEAFGNGSLFLDLSSGFGYTVGKKKYVRKENERENCIGYYAEDDSLFRREEEKELGCVK